MDFPLDYVRGCFTSLDHADEVYFDGVAVPRALTAVKSFEENGFDRDTDSLLKETRESLAFFLNSNVDWAEDEIWIGPDAGEMTTRLSLALASELEPKSEILITELEDEKSLAPWFGLDERGMKIVPWPVKRPSAGIDTEAFASFLTDRTRLVVMAKCSAAVGTVVELLPVALGVQDHASSLLVNWTSFLPHGAIDVRFLRADFIVASTRTFFGSNVGFVWGKRERMQKLRDASPELFEGPQIGAKALAGFRAALGYVEELGLLTRDMQLQPSEDYDRRRHMRRGMQVIRHYERTLTALMMRRLNGVPGIRVYGIRDDAAAAHRLPHLFFRIEGRAPAQVAAALGERHIRVSHGNCGAPRLMKALGLPEDEGAVSATLLHYNSERDIERFADALHDIAHEA